MTEEFWKLIEIRAAERGCKTLSQLSYFMGFERTRLLSFRSRDKRPLRQILCDKGGAITREKKPKRIGVQTWFGSMLYFLDITPEEIVAEDDFYTIDSASIILKSHVDLGEKLKTKASMIDERNGIKNLDVIRFDPRRNFDQKDLDYLAYLLQGPEPVYIHNIPQILSLLQRK